MTYYTYWLTVKEICKKEVVCKDKITVGTIEWFFYATMVCSFGNMSLASRKQNYGLNRPWFRTVYIKTIYIENWMSNNDNM